MALIQRVSKALAAGAAAGVATFSTGLAAGLGAWPVVGAGIASAIGAFLVAYAAPKNAEV